MTASRSELKRLSTQLGGTLRATDLPPVTAREFVKGVVLIGTSNSESIMVRREDIPGLIQQLKDLP